MQVCQHTFAHVWVGGLVGEREGGGVGLGMGRCTGADDGCTDNSRKVGAVHRSRLTSSAKSTAQPASRHTRTTSSRPWEDALSSAV